MNGVKLVWKTMSGDFPELVRKIHEIVQFMDNWKMKTLCTVGVSVASSVAMVVSCGFIARAQLNGVSVASSVEQGETGFEVHVLVYGK
ncbi:ice-structuring protein 4-like [Prunus yedoensis var. nudiflora]|uniref:Ice-structuring protein 4-like n=1 Tax=Prunus yedoensis var. nudiflora TaxID=2094558 RepID=A0A314YV64_PRUYE|nr:ice-structuring protein 4-like [Prunus yedoensis var. nudiflora]